MIFPKKAFTLVETMVTIGIVAMLLGVYASVLFSVTALRRAQYSVQAWTFAQEELETLRALPFGQLSNRTNGYFIGQTVARGAWKTATGNSPPSGTQSLSLATAKTAVVEETGLVALPGNYRDDFTFSAKINALTGSPVGWGTGLAFRYRDAENHYRFRFSAGGIAFDRVLAGTKTTLWSQSATYSPGTWYTLEVVAVGDAFTIKKNGLTLTTVSDANLLRGDLALIALNGVLTNFDDVAVTEDAVTSTWNFDADALGALPAIWQRLSYADLPNGTGTLTIADYLGQTTIKQATVSIGWADVGTHAISASTLISK